MRRTWLRGRDNVAKRYLVHVAGFNLALLMRALTGAGTPRTAAEAATAGLRGGPIYLHADDTTLLIPFVLDPNGHPRNGHHRHHPRAIAFINGLLRHRRSDDRLEVSLGLGERRKWAVAHGAARAIT